MLVTGGFSGYYEAEDSAEVFDPATNTWTVVTPMSEPKFGQRSTLLPGGDVLITGGMESPSQGGLLDTTELFNRPTAAPMQPGGRRQP